MAVREATAKVEDGVKKDTVAKVAPDGGWGWFVVAAFAINFATVVPIIQNFGLVFVDTFRKLQFSDTAVATLINVNYSVGVCLGLFNGPILRTFSFRQVAVFGTLLMFAGMALTATATAFWQFLLFYSILMAAGSGFTMAAFTLAINTYFRKRRGIAMGVAMSVTGLGPVIMPHLIGYGVGEYGGSGTSLILAGFSLHSLVGASLLQPVEWHMKPAPVPVEEIKEEKEEKAEEEESMLAIPVNGNANINHRSSIVSVHSGSGPGRGEGEPGPLRAYPWWNSGTSLDTVDLANTLRVASEEESHRIMEADEADLEPKQEVKQQTETPAEETQTLMKPDPNPEEPVAVLTLDLEKAEPKPGCFKTCFQSVVRFFDLDLLRDPIYVNLMLGMSLAVFAEVNFSLLMPFILMDRDLNTKQTATMMSLIAAADLVFRFLAPFIGKAMKLPSRIMYIIALGLLVVSRTTFIFAESYTAMLSVMLFLGMAKGVRTVFWVLVIPDYVPLERLPAASGIQSLTNGLISMALGPLLGMLRDKMGSYDPIILIMNGITILTIIMWTTEMVICRIRRNKKRLAGKEAIKSSFSHSREPVALN